MYTALASNSTNPLIKDSVLSSKIFDPEYLFNGLVNILGYIFNAKFLGGFYSVLSIFSIFFIAIIVYTTIRMFEIRKKERIHLHHEIEEYKHNQVLKEEKTQKEGVFKNDRWKKVLDYLFSINENDWKLAVIEADSMLFDLLTQLGFKGENLGDKLKDVKIENFRNLNSAWEVHNIRNKIAHEGSSFQLSLHEAKRVIALYESIFLEFGYI
jgi:uncharacterized membrane protein